MKLSPYVVGCASCRLCDGAGYQFPPFLFAGSPTPKVLVMAQNPGEVKADDTFRQKMMLVAGMTLNDASGLKTLYDVDFITSHGHAQLSKIFGENWLTNGVFMYTNAVRCRTVGNATPSEEMITNCMGWTNQLPIPSLVVLMGNVAMQQFSKMVKKPELSAWKIVKLKRDSGITTILTIPHYAAMRTTEELLKARDMFAEAAEKVGLYVED